MHVSDYMKDATAIMEQIKKGAFLTVFADGKVNTMTIGWATIGYIWQRPIFMVAVRDSRYTFTLLEKTDNFSVSIPVAGKCHKALMLCGTKSGRDLDKFAECNLQTKASQSVASPIIDIPGTHYECHVVYKSAMNSDLLHPDLISLYPKKDYHTLYFGEILACYTTA